MKKESEMRGSVLIIGGGIGGMQSALDLAETGYKVYIVESSPSIGGKMAKLDKTFPTNDCAMCVISPKLVDCSRHRNIEILSYSDVEGISGSAGNFNVKVRRKSRYVDEEKCTGCGECEKVCPVEIMSAFDENLITRRAIYRPYPQAVPAAFLIDKKTDGAPACSNACPINQPVQGYVRLIAQRRFDEAIHCIRNNNPFPSICGRVCTHACETECKRGDLDEPVAIASLKRFAADYELKNKDEILVEKEDAEKPEKVAVVGSGPAGLTCAWDLALKGYRVTVFEKETKAGGIMAWGIPDFRLPKDIVDTEVSLIKKAGVEIRTGKEINDVEALKKEFDAVFVAIGCQSGTKLNIEGEDLDGVLRGLDFLRDVNLGKKVKLGKRVAVIGGGNVAMDSVATALRLGAEQAFIIYRRSREEMPASTEEIEEIEEEGIKLHFLVAPNRIKGKNGRINKINCVKMKLGEPDESGRRRPVKIEGSEFDIDVDNIIAAIGQRPDTACLKDILELTDWKTIKVNPISLETSIDGVFAGGDIVSGARTIVEAIAAGHKAAESIRRYLTGEDMEKGREEIPEDRKIAEPDIKGIKVENRIRMDKIDLEKRKKSFEEINPGYKEELAVREAGRCLNCNICSECFECVRVCDANAIDHDIKEKVQEINVGAVIVSTGYDLFDAGTKKEYGYGRYKNVISSMEFERILSASGPFKGELVRPFDGKKPERIAFIQCVGSRDIKKGNEYCSSVCCMYTAKEAIIAKEHEPGLETTVFCLDVRAYGKEFEKYYERAKDRYGVRYVNSMISRFIEVPENKNILIKYMDEDSRIKEEEFDMVVLAAGITPSKYTDKLADILGIELNAYGFIKTDNFSPVCTTKQGIFVSGTSREPGDIPKTVIESSAAAAKVSELLAEKRGSETREKVYPKEKDVSEEEERIGVYICSCGRNIASVVDVGKVVEEAKKLDNVVFAENALYSCSQDSLEEMKKNIEKYKLNRLVVASCSTRTHEPLFRDTVREAALNKYLFEMTNIRDQCSWVHMNFPEQATDKAVELVRMAVSKARLLKPIEISTSDVNSSCLVVGGGVSGMTAALSLAGQGFPVHLVEKNPELGGETQKVYCNIEGEDVQKRLGGIINKIVNNDKIGVYLDSEIIENSGFTGNLKTKIKNKKGEITEIEHGTLIVATGGIPNVPESYLYGKNDRVVTQRELEEIIHGGKLDKDIKNIVMIQCVESRDETHPYCSKICCSHAMKNALKLKDASNDINIHVLFRDIRTYGFKEKYYLKARENNVKFTRYDKDNKPRLVEKGGQLQVKVFDKTLEEEISIPADMVVLSTGIIAADSNEKLSKILKLPLTEDGFFLEAHAKLRPLDFSKDGFYMCGLAHSPSFIDEAISRGYGAAARAATILAKDNIDSEGIIATVNELICRGCGLCIEACPYDARSMDEEKKIAVVNDVLCQGCGACVVACPSGASCQKGFEKAQIFAMIDEIK